jgi:hypothetical protein
MPRLSGQGVFALLSVLILWAQASSSAQINGAAPLWQTIPADLAQARGTGVAVAIEPAMIRRAAGEGGTWALPLTRELSVQAVVGRTASTPSQTFVHGALTGGYVGEASLTVVGDALSGRVVVDGRLFMIRRAANSNLHVVTEVDERMLPPEAEPLEPLPSIAAAEPALSQPAAVTDSNAFVDLMVLYTPAARAAIGGTSAMAAEIAGAVNNANLALSNASVVHRFRLAHYEEVAYVEPGTGMSTTLDRLTNPSDGVIDNVPVLRDRYGADVVTLLTAESDYCGIGWQMSPSNVNTAFAALAFNVVSWSCANTNLSMAHEIGHNMGLSHDRANAGGSSPSSPYAYGYAVSGVARDVMAYACPASCPRKAVFSTPLANFPGLSITAGTATEDNGRALNDTSPVVANFRHRRSADDFDDDLKSDVGVFRPSTGTWFVLKSTTGGATWMTGQWGSSGDLPVPSDYDGDGRIDFAVYSPSNGLWQVFGSLTGTPMTFYWGGDASDVPVRGDFDGDGKTDIAVYRRSKGIWYVINSSTGAGGTFAWGGSADDIPVPGDYDGDGRSDLAIFRPSARRWFIVNSGTSAPVTYEWGAAGDTPVPADYDGDGRTDLAIFRASQGAWYIIRSRTWSSISFNWGINGDLPVTADYDGDGMADVGVYRPSNGSWFILRSDANYTAWDTYRWGTTGDLPLWRP